MTLLTESPYAVNYYFERWAHSITYYPFSVYLNYIYRCYFNFRIVVVLIRQHRTSGRWSFPPVKVDKSYDHIHFLQARIVEARLTDQQGMIHSVLLDADDQRRLGRTIVPTDWRPTAEFQHEKISCFQIKTWYYLDCIVFLYIMIWSCIIILLWIVYYVYYDTILYDIVLFIILLLYMILFHMILQYMI